MKTCPICGARAFDDAETCFGCLHRYSEEEETRAASGAPASGAAPSTRRQQTMLAPDEPPAPASPAAMVPEDAWPEPEPEPEPQPAPAASASVRPAGAPQAEPASEAADPGLDGPGSHDEFVCDGFDGEDFQPGVAVPLRSDAVLPPSAFSLSLPLSDGADADGWTLRLEWPQAGSAAVPADAAAASRASRGFVLSLQPARPAARGSHARSAEAIPAAPSGLA